MLFYAVTVALTALAASIPTTLGANGFLNTCTSPSLKGSTLKASCINGGGGNNDASIDLNNCLTNSNGALGSPGNGAFDSCKDCSLSGGDLTCSCTRPNGQGDDFSTIDLNTCIGNNGGVLVC